jgi:hypothetical protein
MSSTIKKNLPASVRQRLLNLSETKDIAFELILSRYGVERLLYRLTKSKHKDSFLLKGAMLFAVWLPEAHRPTRDVDLLGFGSSELDLVERMFKELCVLPVEDDGLVFSQDSVTVREIREDAHYAGVRVTLFARLANSKVHIQVDIGYGDAVFPDPETVTFPVLLDFPAPMLRAYPIYTVVAEKLEAMVVLGEANSRMKDFFDLWFLSENFNFERSILMQAIKGTFDRRRSPLPKARTIYALSDTFSQDKKEMWQAFLKRNGLKAIDLSNVLNRLSVFLQPMLEEDTKTSALEVWKAGKGWESRRRG